MTLRNIRKTEVTKVDIMNEDGNVEEITTKMGIEKECMQETIKICKQSNDTPCMKVPLRDEIGYEQ